MARVLELKSCNPEFKSHPDSELDWFQVISDSTPWQHLVHNWSVSCQLGFLTREGPCVNY